MIDIGCRIANVHTSLVDMYGFCEQYTVSSRVEAVNTFERFVALLASSAHRVVIVRQD